MKLTKMISLFALIAAIPFAAFSATYKIDADHSSVGFTIRHIVSKVHGRFDKFSGTFNYDEKDTKSWKTDVTINPASINTNVEKRDNHLRSKDFFDVAKFPTMTFVSTKVTDVKGNKAKLQGKLTMHGVTKDVVLDLENLGVQKDPWGNVISSFSASGKLNRKDYGLTWNEALETGGVLVGDEVELVLEIAGLLQEEPKKDADKAAKK